MATRGQSRGRSELHKSNREVVNGLENAGSAVQRMASDGVDQIRDTAAEYFERGRDKARELSEQLETQVRDQPSKSLLIAAGIGFLVGVYFMRR